MAWTNSHSPLHYPSIIVAICTLVDPVLGGKAAGLADRIRVPGGKQGGVAGDGMAGKYDY